MDFDQETVDQLVADAEAHAQRLASISEKAVAQSTELRQAVSSGNFDRAKQIISDQQEPRTPEQSGGSLESDEDGGGISGLTEQRTGGQSDSKVGGERHGSEA